MNPKELINGQLLQAREACPVSPDVMNLLKRRITPESDVLPMEYLFRIFNTPCFPRGELVAVAGKAKSGKTFFTSMLMAACLTPKVLALERFGHTDSTDNTDGLRVRDSHTEITESTERASPTHADGNFCGFSDFRVTDTFTHADEKSV